MRGLKNIRHREYNYKANGYYFVTIVSRHRRNLFAGKKGLIEAELKDLIKKTKGLEVDYYAVMDNHIHLIFVLSDCELALGETVRRLKAKISHKLGIGAWQPNYYEHVIRSERALEKIREYIINNPLAEILKFEKFYKSPADKSAGYREDRMKVP
ncbi:MAG: hypothetical protein A2826_00265 [Candidatus Doudnabacteria bacterium RIFCSPHIGHO2_01_FULL_43_23]|uniref:Transposase IS200-like domain-containing protein n=1 Tax=Candidatus Doudnabacteria bacterium RIFCSPHIGHO2_01_FULL_43_23 TaxID=1817822 RepID=A0A1F5NTF6_9BACT|nr:MAG: hypothetical protein A2826_00265 [Candidatus Doudnabacteria bacterium RIFCSPHIGHO2_01_FULL_43_23]